MKAIFLIVTFFSGLALAIPNPASVYCVENEGTIEMRKDSKGNEDGVCVFKDKTECGEWAFFRHTCKQGDCMKWSVDENACM